VGLNLLMKTRMKLPFQSQSASLITYADHSYSTTAVAAEDFVQRYKVGEKCRCLFNWTLEINENPGFIKEMNISYSLMILTQPLETIEGSM
jgi:hypothetical protein